jgi:hypothetical protein
VLQSALDPPVRGSPCGAVGEALRC